MNILRKCQNQNQVKEIENGQQPAPRSPRNSYSSTDAPVIGYVLYILQPEYS